MVVSTDTHAWCFCPRYLHWRRQWWLNKQHDCGSSYMIPDLPMSTGPCPASFWHRHRYMSSLWFSAEYGFVLSVWSYRCISDFETTGQKSLKSLTRSGAPLPLTCEFRVTMDSHMKQSPKQLINACKSAVTTSPPTLHNHSQVRIFKHHL